MPTTNATGTTRATTSATAVLASDFSPSTVDVNRHRWTLGKLRYLINALDGAPVAVTVDASSGHTLIGVRLVRAFDGGPSRGPRLAIEHADGHVTNYYAHNIGPAVIPLEQTGRGAKWDALDAWRTDSGEAVRRAQAEHGETAGRAWGRWRTDVDTAAPGARVSVAYEPITSNPAFADRWGTRWHGVVSIA